MPVRSIDNTVKVYTREVSSNPWVLNEKLTCLSVTDCYGLIQPHTANLKLKTPDMKNYSDIPAEQTEIDEAKKAMRYDADVELSISEKSVFYRGITGLWCQVTTEQLVDVEGTPTLQEVTIFVGQIIGNNLGFANLMCDGVYALGLDWCLSMQSAVGSLCASSELGEVDHYDSVKPYFNPKDRPNKNVAAGGENVFDYSLFKNINDETAYWKPSTIVAYLLERLNYQMVDAYPTEKRYAYFSTLTDTQLSLDNDTTVFTNEQKSSDYDVTGMSLWAVLVQLVEVNGLYTLSIKYDSTTPAEPIVRLHVLEL